MAEEFKKKTDAQVDSLKAQYETNKQDLLEYITSLVCDIKPELHVNARVE